MVLAVKTMTWPSLCDYLCLCHTVIRLGWNPRCLETGLETPPQMDKCNPKFITRTLGLSRRLHVSLSKNQHKSTNPC